MQAGNGMIMVASSTMGTTMNLNRALLETVEPRRLLSFATLDSSFGRGGIVQIDTNVG